MTHEFLSVQPSELKFPFELKKQVSCSLQLINGTPNYIAFKVKTTSPKKYCVRPNTGVILPRSSTVITVTMQAQREAPPDLQCKDKFLLQCVVAPDGTSTKDVSQDLFTKESGQDVQEIKLKVVYLPSPQPPSPVAESAEEGSSLITSFFPGNGDRSFFYGEPASKEISELKAKLTEAWANLTSLTKERDAILQKNKSLEEDLSGMLDAIKTKTKTAKARSGFSFVFVILVAVLGILVGYLLSA